MLAPVLEGEAGEDPKGGALVEVQGEGRMRGGEGRLGAKWVACGCWRLGKILGGLGVTWNSAFFLLIIGTKSDKRV